MNKVNLSRSVNSKPVVLATCVVISARKAKHLDVTTMFTYSHAKTPLSQSEGAYYLSYFINIYCTPGIIYSIISIFIHSSLKGVYESNPFYFFASVFEQSAALKRRRGFTQLSKSNFICDTDQPKI